MRKKLSRLVFTAAIGIVMLGALACARDGMMMDGDQMMKHMKSNPQMMRQMMEQMHKDPQMMQQMSEWMLQNPEHCARMAEHMSKNPEACRNMMQAMAKHMDSAAGQQMMQHCGAMMSTGGNAAAASAAASGAGPQEATVNVSASGFSSAAINVRRGQPVRIHFKRDDQPTCADEVGFPDLNIRRKLPANETTTVEVTPADAGTLTFACDMDMMKGKLVVQ